MKNVFGGLAIGCGALIAVAGGALFIFLLGYFREEELTWAMKISLSTPALLGLGFVAIGVFLVFFVPDPPAPPAVTDTAPVPPEDLRRAAPKQDSE